MTLSERSKTKTITLEPAIEEPAPEMFGQRKRPDLGKFRLQVDRQTKASFETFEAAEKRGLDIKTKYPSLQVAIYDVAGSVNTIIEATPKP
jgi:hypothetical protein